MPFTLRLVLALIIAAALAAAIAPFAAVALASAGYRFPFPRIFDRTVMVTVAAMMALWARELRVWPLLRHGFANPPRNTGAILRGLLIAAVVIAILLALGALSGARNEIRTSEALARLPKYLAGAAAIAVIE